MVISLWVRFGVEVEKKLSHVSRIILSIVLGIEKYNIRVRLKRTIYYHHIVDYNNRYKAYTIIIVIEYGDKKYDNNK